MWIASLVTGYLWIVGTILFTGHQLAGGEGLARLAQMEADRQGMDPAGTPPVPEALKKPPLIALLAFGAFLLAFFTVHFVGFHLGHSMFLRMFFPLDGVTEETSLDKVVVITLLMFWPFVVISIFDKTRNFVRDMREARAFNFFAPYAAVIKNHIMIFVVGFASVLLKENWMLWALLIFYFFPWAEIFRDRKKTAQAS